MFRSLPHTQNDTNTKENCTQMKLGSMLLPLRRRLGIRLGCWRFCRGGGGRGDWRWWRWSCWRSSQRNSLGLGLSWFRRSSQRDCLGLGLSWFRKRRRLWSIFWSRKSRLLWSSFWSRLLSFCQCNHSFHLQQLPSCFTSY